MQITNNLQIPLEIQLFQHSSYKHNLSSSLEEESKSSLFVNQTSFFGQAPHELRLKPEQSLMIPLRACGFDHVRMRPYLATQSSKDASSSIFDWTDTVAVSLLQDDREIFERKPMVMMAKVAKTLDRHQRHNNRVFFMLNANVYSIRSFIDFNTQQTEFISLKYLSISPPFTLQNLLPVTLFLQFKNIIREPL